MRPTPARRLPLPLFFLWILSWPAMAAMAQDSPLTVLVFHRPPYYVVEDGPRFGGFLLDYTRRVLNAADIPFAFEEAPPQRILKTLEDGERPVCAVGWLKTASREAYAVFSHPIHLSRPIGAAVRADDSGRLPRDPTAEALLSSGMRLGLRHGFSYGDWLDARVAAQGIAADRSVAENKQILDMIARGRIDYTFIGPEEYGWLTDRNPALRRDTRFVTLSGVPAQTPRHIMCGKGLAPERMARIDAAITSLGPAAP